MARCPGQDPTHVLHGVPNDRHKLVPRVSRLSGTISGKRCNERPGPLCFPCRSRWISHGFENKGGVACLALRYLKLPLAWSSSI
jgi:hypothetical protein